MRYSLLIILITFLGLSCKEVSKVESEKPELVMAETSEMAQLMREMYAYNETIKQQVIKGEISASYPSNFDRILTATLTDPTDRDSLFEVDSKLFLNTERLIFEASDEEDIVAHYNNAVNACISCHNVTCTGPIPRIKKLLIK
jgi:hypothetical protein